MPVACANVFEILSADVLGLVLDELKQTDIRSLKKLRLVSKATNSPAEPLVFTSIHIRFTLHSHPFIKHQLSTLASGKSPASRWAKKLTIGRLMPLALDSGKSQSDDFQEEAREPMLGCQKEFLIPAIQALRNLTFASFHISKRGPDVDVLRALSQLPKLRDIWLSLSQCPEPTYKALPLDEFANLRSLKFTPLPMSKHLMKSIGLMIAQSPTLEELQIGFQVGDANNPSPGAYFDTIFQSATRSSTFAPSLTKLTVTNNNLTISALSVPFLRSLVHLSVHHSAGKIESSFWEALTKNEVRIRYLAGCRLDPEGIRYLTSYEGLEELHVRGYSGLEADAVSESSNRIFHLVLFHHRKSLRKLSFEASWDFRSWAITEEYLDCVLKCQALRNLVLVYHYPDESRGYPAEAQEEKLSMDLSTLLNRITKGLTNLEKLKLSPIRKYPYFFCGSGAILYRRNVAELFVQEICEVAIAGARNPTFRIHGMDQRYEIHMLSHLEFDPDSRHFKRVLKAKNLGDSPFRHWL